MSSCMTHAVWHGDKCALNAWSYLTYGQNQLRGPLNVFIVDTLQQRLKMQINYMRKAKKLRMENNNAKIHHKRKLGYGISDLDTQRFSAVVAAQEKAREDYQKALTITPDEELFKRSMPVYIRQRILRKV